MKQTRHKKGLSPGLRVLASLMIAVQLLTCWPVTIWAAGVVVNDASAPRTESARPARINAPAAPKANRSLPALGKPKMGVSFSNEPNDEEIKSARVFQQPLVAADWAAKVDENRALALALAAFFKSEGTDLRPLEKFLGDFPDSRWRASLLANLGIVYQGTGYWSKALAAWEESWRLSKDAGEPGMKAVGDQALGYLAQLNSRLGRFERLESLFREIEGRDVQGPATEKVSGARAGLWLMRHKPGDAFRCGPMALARIQAVIDPKAPFDERIMKAQSTIEGMSLSQVNQLAGELGLDLQMAFRDPGAQVFVPCVVNWKVGHYAALVAEKDGQYLSQDPTFWDDVLVTPQALDAEASGYFLVPKGPLPKGWRSVRETEGDEVWGKGNAGPNSPPPPPANIEKSKPDPPCPGMAGYNMDAARVSLMLSDIPVGYVPPRGPAVGFEINYGQRDMASSANISNLGPKWNMGWLSYITDLSVSNTKSYGPGGGELSFDGFDTGTQQFALQRESGVILAKTGPDSYEKRYRDGSVEIFDLPDSATSARRILRTKSIDPAGNALTFTYDGSFRLAAVSDALGQVTILSYELAADPYKVTKVTDPFGRFATLEYNASGRLWKATDVLGLVSEFNYGTGDFVTSLTTPYGTTQFSFGEEGYTRWLEITDPQGSKERVEFRNEAPGFLKILPANQVPSGLNVFNDYMNYRNTFYWDKKAMKEAPGDYTKARLTHWLHTADINVASGTKESEKEPYENRVWYNYPGQPWPGGDGASNRPTKVARVLEDGTTQLYQYEYNGLGKLTRSTDPVGRETLFEYDPANDVDLLQIKQKNEAAYDLLGTFTYNSQHQPLTATNAAGQTTVYTYNAFGQPETITNAKSETTTFNYDPAGDGYLENIEGPVSAATTAFDYDGYGRVRTVTDSEGYAVTTDYDIFDRPTKVTYPDGTYKEVTYDRLDAAWSRDRLGRWSRTWHNALRQVVATMDPLYRLTQFEWCKCGSLKALIDASGNRTGWNRDVQGRVTTKVYADGKKDLLTYETTTSRLKSSTDAKGQVNTYGYYPDNKLEQIVYTNAEHPTASVHYTYDPIYNRVAMMSDGTGNTIYNHFPISDPPALGAGRLESIDGPLDDDTIAFGYDELGRVNSRSTNGPANASTVFYDTLGRVETESNVLGTFLYGYVNTTGRLQSVTYPNVQSTSLGYLGNEEDQRLEEIKHLDPTDAVLSQFDYHYDVTGQIDRWTQVHSGMSEAQRYALRHDAADQLTGAKLTNAVSGTSLSEIAYGYDKVGNRTREQVGEMITTAGYNQLNQLKPKSAGGPMVFSGTVSEPATVTVGGNVASVDAGGNFRGLASVQPGENSVAITATDASGNARTSNYVVTVPTGTNQTFLYDANGNLSDDGARSYEWDAANRLIAIDYTGTTQRSEFIYDGLSRRVAILEKDDGTVTNQKQFVWVGMEIAEERDVANTVTKRYFGQGVQMFDPVTTTIDAFYYSRDHLGSVRELTDSAGAVRARYDYDLYGRRSKVGGDMDADFGFTGHYYHTASTLALAPYRAYDAEIGRWLSRDPIGENGGINLYGYVRNDPINDLDPLGLWGANEAHGDWMNIASQGFTEGGLSGYAKVVAGTLGMTAIDYWGARTLENNAGKAGDAAGRDCYGEALGYGSLAGGQIALSAVGAFGANNLLHPFYRFIGPGSRAGFGPGTWLVRGTAGSIPYQTVANAASKLQIPTQSAVTTAVRAENVWWRWVAGPRRVGGNPQWGAGGGLEYRVGGF